MLTSFEPRLQQKGNSIYAMQDARRNSAFDLCESTAGLDPYFDRTEGFITRVQAALLYELAKSVPADQCIVEVGSYRGRSTVALARGSLDGHKAPVFALDPHEDFRGILGGSFGPPDRGAFFQAMLATSSYHIVRLVNLSSEIVTPAWNRVVGLLWIDGDHREEAVRRDWMCWQPHLAADAVVAFDDSTNTDLGPYRLIEDLLASKAYELHKQVEKITALRRVPPMGRHLQESDVAQ